MASGNRVERRERGAVLVEFALIFPFLALLAFGVLDFGYMINRDTLVNNAAREGAREGSLNPVSGDIDAVVRSVLSDLDQTAITVTVTCRKADDSACGDFDTDAESGGVVIVDVQYEHDWLSFVPGAVGLGDTKSLGKTMEMRIE